MKSNLLNKFFVLIPLLLLTTVQIQSQITNGMAAEGILGQLDFVTRTASATDSTFNGPSSIAIDPLTGKVFIADRANHRILRFSATNAYLDGGHAEAVIGQSDFVTGTSGLAQNKFNTPIGIFVDANGTLWVSDFSNNRVLKFNNASTISNGANADIVLGQPDFTTNSTAATADKMAGPVAVYLDGGGRLWVALFNQHRVLRFDNAASKANGASADGVLGQPDFTTITSGLTSSNMNNANGVFVDAQSRLWVSEYTNRRILRFDNAAVKPNGSAADGVLGQPDFTTNTAVLSASGSSGTRYVFGDANGNIYVPHESYHRLVIFLNAASKSNGADADYVLGQTDFVTGTFLDPPTTSSLRTPRAVFIDNTQGNLWLADWANNRVLRYDVSSIVPVELAAFTANIISDGVELKWETATETNNKGFEIQKSKEGSEFITLAFIHGKGTTTEKQHYSYLDKTDITGSIYYRLKQIDYDGSFRYSEVVALNQVNVPTEFVLHNNYPNPFNPSTVISFSAPDKESVKLIIYNSLGEVLRNLFSGEANAGINNIYWNGLDDNGSNVSSGIYLYVLQTGNKTLSAKMILQK